MWRNFREELRDLTKEEKLNKVAKFFAKFPIGSRCIDFYTPEDWPTPWEILYHKTYCASTVSLLQYHTLATVLKDNAVSIVLIDDGRDRFLVPIIDNEYILNYILGEVTRLEEYKEIRIVDDFDDDTIPHIT